MIMTAQKIGFVISIVRAFLVETLPLPFVIFSLRIAIRGILK